MKNYSNMDGYINEDEIEELENNSHQGGQLKTKNGQKYVLNNHQKSEGIVLSKTGIVGLIILFLMAIIITFLLTYFFLPRCSNFVTSNESNETLHTGSIWKEHGHSYENGERKELLNDHSENDDLKEEEIEFHKGWEAEHYDLLLEPIISDSLTKGQVVVKLKRDHQIKELKPIVFDLTEIEIVSCTVEKLDRGDVNQNLEFLSEYGVNNQSYIINFKETKHRLTNVSVKLEFISKLTSTLQGFYKGSFINENTKTESSFVSTQFSPIDARRAFPCIDRPYAKATFKIQLVRPTDKAISLSNMPLETVEYVRDGYIKETFKVTPKMSTYLVAFHISDLKEAKGLVGENDKLPHIKMYAQPGYENMTGFAYSLTAKSLPFFEKYFEIPFNLPKIDMVAVPDFGFNAMENWGLITFRESALLAPENMNSSSVLHLQRLSGTLVHEVAHQWFGNLVTMVWYDDLWLKEGFATYLSYVGIDSILPQWEYFKSITQSEFQKAMPKDCDSSSRPISFPVKTQSDIRRVFDPISYSKGALIINMMRGFLGEDVFKLALTNYLNKFSYSNAVGDDLWNEMEAVAKTKNILNESLSVKKIMDSWTIDSAGFPVVTVRRNGTDLVISQQRYFLPYINDNDTTSWYIPISYSTKSRSPTNEIPEYWLTKEQNEVLVIENAAENDEWVYININRTGYFRTNYDQLSWKNLIKGMADLSDVTRGMLIDDAFALARANLTDYDIPLTLGVFLRNMEMTSDNLNYLSWYAFEGGLEYLNNMLKRESAYGSLRTVMKYIVSVPFENYNFDEIVDQTDLDILHRQRIVQMACDYGIDKCLQTAQLIFRNWIENKNENKIPPNLKSTIYCVTLREGGSLEWNFAFKQYEETTSASEKEIILSALGCTQKPWLLSKYLNMIIMPNSTIRKQDGARVFSSVAKNSLGAELAFDFLYTNLAEIAAYYGDGFNTVQKMVDSSVIFMNKQYHLEQFERFAEKANQLGLVAIEKSIKLAKIEIDKNIFWRNNLYDKLKTILDKAIKDWRLTQ